MNREDFEKTLNLNPTSMQGGCAIFMKTDGTEESVYPKDGMSFSLKEMQEYVGGYIGVIHAENQVLIFHEEEMYKPNPVLNEEATKIYCEWFGRDNLELFGAVLLCPSTMMK